MTRARSNNQQKTLPIWAIWIIAALASFALAAVNSEGDVASTARFVSAHRT
ncbi:putative membrane protein [Paraburkholderia terricola]|uniref:Uncharacterized protein n=1 Tax=Paraburkholderia terricola TaxID=169427 RepID=A0A1M6RUS6_9BURK|nr:hypothetical protein [Paraburkholderia terricola]MDR6493568.1 putative membrane protein [Paraburkholderia terricola]SDO55893.1 hypothetical protein SAMN05192547_1019107 [Paraburkholderia sediminicola]SHK36251.1 hypothetical protein SAMN05192548_10204 [Paraburkholderia terricola]